MTRGLELLISEVYFFTMRTTKPELGGHSFHLLHAIYAVRIFRLRKWSVNLIAGEFGVNVEMSLEREVVHSTSIKYVRE